MTTGVLRVGSSTVRIRPARTVDIAASMTVGRDLLPVARVEPSRSSAAEVRSILDARIQSLRWTG